jgi:hypothetical protein
MKEAMIHNTMGSGIMWGRRVVGIVGIVVLMLVVAAIVKYVFPGLPLPRPRYGRHPHLTPGI